MAARDHLVKEGIVAPPRLPAPLDLDGVVPLDLNEFVGRKREIAALESRLRHAGRCLLTLVGPPGVGKSRLAREVARKLSKEFANRLCFVSFRDVGDHGRVIPVIADQLKIQETAGQALITNITTRIGQSPFLLVFDDFEQVAEPASKDVLELLAKAPNLKILITSRLPLVRRPELRVAPLDPPDPRLPATPENILQSDAVQLFIYRVKEYDDSFAITPKNAPLVAEICQQLSGLPLAIELAAGWRKSISLDKLPKMLDQLLMSHKEPLRPAFDLSYRLLPEEADRVLFRQLGVFVGGFDLDAVRAVCQIDNDRSVNMYHSLRHLIDANLLSLRHLIDANLLPPPADGSNGRYMLLTVFREYVRELLIANNEIDILNRRHAVYYLNEAVANERWLRGADQVAALEWFEREHENLIAALRWSLQSEVTLAVELAGALWRFWWMRGHFTAGRDMLQQVLDQSKTIDTPGRVELFNGLATLTRALGDKVQAAKLCEASLELARSTQDMRGEATALIILGASFVERTLHKQGEEYLRESKRLCQLLTDEPWLLAWCDHHLGRALRASGRFAEAEAPLQASLALYNRLGDRWLAARALNWLGIGLGDSGKYVEAQKRLEQGLEWSQELNDKLGVAYLLFGLAKIACRKGEYRKALKYTVKRLRIERALGNNEGIANALSWIGWIIATRRKYRWGLSYLLESLNIYKKRADQGGIAHVLGWIGIIEGKRGHTDAARANLEVCRHIYEKLEDNLGIAHVLMRMGEVEYWQYEFSKAYEYNEKRLEIERSMGNLQGVAHALAWLGLIRIAQKNYSEALILLQQSHTYYEDLGDQTGIASCYHWLGIRAIDTKELSHADKHLKESLRLYDKLEAIPDVLVLLEELAGLAIARGQLERAATLFGTAQQQRKLLCVFIAPVECATYTERVGMVCPQLHVDPFQKFWAEGREMSLKQAVTYALREGA